MKLKEHHFCRPEDRLAEAIRKIDENLIQIVFVTDADRKLVGSLSDGDIRRAFLKGTGLDQPISGIMNINPKRVAADKLNRFEVMRQMMAKSFRQMPVVDESGRVVDILLLTELVKTPGPSSAVVILAGGKGQRLLPLTEEVPKPLLEVGGRPILDILVDQVAQQGFKKVYVSVNYLADQVMAFLGDGGRYGVEITYLREESPLGTAGPLANVASEARREPVVIMNGDLLTNVSFSSMVNFHELHGLHLTMAVKDYQFQVPYGVVKVDNELEIVEVDEKPTHKFFVNAGMYVASGELIDLIPKGQRMDMPDLMKLARQRQFKVGAFPVREYWLDIGRMDDYQQAQRDYDKYFRS